MLSGCAYQGRATKDEAKLMDKHAKLREQLIKNFAPAYPTAIVETDDGFRTQFPIDYRLFLAERFARILQADTDWFEHVISHQPTVGAFYEVILRNTLRELAPAGYEIVTGFVLDPYRPIHSKQLDIIAYDRTNSSPVFKSGELVVVRPSSVVSLTEVKKTLRMRDIEETIDGTFFSNLGTRRPTGDAYEGVQQVNIFGFSSKLKPARIANAVRDYLDKKIRYTKVRHKASRKEGSIVLQQIVLPSIFVRNDRFYLNCGLVPTKDVGSYKVEVTVHESLEESGCIGAFLLNALPMLHGEHMSFIGHQMQVIIEQVETNNVLVLSTTVPMREIVDTFIEDGRAIREFRVRGQAPHAVRIPKGLHWKHLKSFDEFAKKVGLDAFQVEEERELPSTQGPPQE
jgi:hypothetical protein